MVGKEQFQITLRASRSLGVLVFTSIPSLAGMTQLAARARAPPISTAHAAGAYLVDILEIAKGGNIYSGAFSGLQDG